MLALGIYGISFLIYESEIYTSFGNRIEVLFDTFHTILLPLLLFIFVLIQGAKRMHDINISGWNFLIPIYNIYLVFSKGTRGNNNFGIDPNPVKNTLQIETQNLIEKNTIVTITDLAGKVLTTKTLQVNNGTIDVADLPKGLHLINFKNMASPHNMTATY
jgi:hypothetical protein